MGCATTLSTVVGGNSDEACGNGSGIPRRASARLDDDGSGRGRFGAGTHRNSGHRFGDFDDDDGGDTLEVLTDDCRAANHHNSLK